jgi:hypothetical protein
MANPGGRDGLASQEIGVGISEIGSSGRFKVEGGKAETPGLT